ncbi:MAG: MBL fold metallo-hydrolase [Candidatus Bathyarchaeota archaeon]
MEIIWHGHSCFEMKDEKTSIVFDPFGGIGLPEPRAKADIVLCSHSHGDHNNVKPVLGEGGIVLEGFIGTKEVKGISVTGVATLHDTMGGSQRGKNTIYVVQMDGLQICHLGDLGHDLTAEQVKEIGKIDIVFSPVAGGATIGPEVATAIITKLDPKIVLPMHYNTGVSGAPPWFPRAMPIAIEEFLKGKNNVERIKSRSLKVTKDNLPQEQKIMVLT